MRTSLFSLFAMLFASIAGANEYEASIRSYLTSEIAPWQNESVLVDAIRAQNSRTASMTQAQIDSLDAAWRAEVGTANTPTITPVLANAAAEFLRGRVVAAGGRITEIFIMDSRGLNVAASDVTSDYWQGDEAKFTATFPNGPGTVHIGEIEFDDSSQIYQGQVSIVIADPATGIPIGAMTVGLDAAAL